MMSDDKPHYGRGQHPNSRANLGKGKPFKTGEERTREAGRTSGERRGAFKTFASIIISVLEADDGKLKDLVGKRLVKLALEGNMPAIQYIVKLIGEEPSENINITTTDFSALDKVMEYLDNKDSGED